MLKSTEMGLEYEDFSKQPLNMAPKCCEKWWVFLLSNGFPLYLPHLTGVETEASYSSYSIHLYFLRNTGDLGPAERIAVPVTHLHGH